MKFSSGSGTKLAASDKIRKKLTLFFLSRTGNLVVIFLCCAMLMMHQNSYGDVGLDLRPQCKQDDLRKLLPPSVHVDPSSSLIELLAVAKVAYFVMHPLEKQQHVPLVLQDCESMLRTKQSNKNRALYHDTIVRHSALKSLIPLDVPEKIMDLLFEIDTSMKATIIDVGANVGQFSLPLVKSGHTVYSFEPVNTTCLTLRQRSAAMDDGTKNHHIHCFGIDDVEQEQSFGYIGEEVLSPSYHLIDAKHPDAVVKSVVRTSPVHMFIPLDVHVDLFKTDTQGNEMAVLRGSRELLCSSRNAPRWVLVEFSQGLLESRKTDPKEIVEFLYGCDYVCTHAAYHHPVKTNSHGGVEYGILDTPEMPPSSGRRGGSTPSETIVGFKSFLWSINRHNQWKKDGKPIEKSLQGKSGWTDLLCVR